MAWLLGDFVSALILWRVQATDWHFQILKDNNFTVPLDKAVPSVFMQAISYSFPFAHPGDMVVLFRQNTASHVLSIRRGSQILWEPCKGSDTIPVTAVTDYMSGHIWITQKQFWEKNPSKTFLHLLPKNIKPFVRSPGMQLKNHT